MTYITWILLLYLLGSYSLPVLNRESVLVKLNWCGICPIMFYLIGICVLLYHLLVSPLCSSHYTSFPFIQ